MKDVAEYSPSDAAKEHLARFSSCLASAADSRTHDIALLIDVCQKQNDPADSAATTPTRGQIGKGYQEIYE